MNTLLPTAANESGIQATRRERPIIMSGDNPKLILDGLKTQTRRIVNYDIDPESVMHFNYGKSEGTRCPYGKAGDRIWVRETHAWVDYMEDSLVREDPVCVAYRCDRTVIRHECGEQQKIDTENWNWAHKSIKWRPSIHMPKWAARTWLEITKVRVERLQDISEEDAKAEGMIDTNCFSLPNVIATYRVLWESLHGKGAWDKNPWVWAIEFCLSPKESSTPVASKRKQKPNESDL